MALFFGHALPYMATNNDGNLYAELLPADQRVEAASGTQEIADGCLDSRVVDLRSRVEEQLNANLLFNSSMAGATGSVLPTNWASGSVSGLTYTISSASTVQGFRSIEWTVSGTALSDGDIYLACEPMQSGTVSAQIPSEYVGSMYCAKVSGTIKAAMVLQTLTQNFVDGAVQETKTKDLAAVTGQTFVRIEPNSVKTDIDLENRVNLRLYQPIASGEVVDFTIRVAAPQVEAGFVASPFITTTTGAASRVTGQPSLLIVPQLTRAGFVYPQLPTVSGADFTFTRATTATRVNASGLIESVASGLLRLDYPIGGGCPAGLIEASAQNLCLQSEAIGITSWSNTAVTASPNVSATLDPAGGNTAEKIIATAVSGNHFTTRAASTQVGQHTFSVFAKAAEYSFIRLQDVNTAKYSVWYDLVSGTANGTGASIQNYGNGWYRCIVTYDGSGASVANALAGVPVSGGGVSYTGDGTSGVYVWGAQLETGAIPTSYIPTTTGSATRNADVVSVSGAVSGAIGQTEGTIYAEFTNTLVASYVEGYMYRVFADANNEIWARKEGGTNTYSFRWRANSQNTTFLNVAVPNGVNKIAFGYKSGDTALFLNGSQVATTNTDVRAFSVNPTTIALGSTSSGQFFNDRLRAAAIYTTRLSNDQLANLTRLT